jgi:putative peptidoglycan lipid II flippase
VFYALGRNRTPVLVSIVTVLINAGLNITLVRVLGYRGLALGTSIAALFNATVLLTLLRGHLGGLQEGRLASSFARVAAASAVMGVAASAADGALRSVLPGDGVVLQIVRLASTIGIALVVLAGASWLLRIKEFTDAVSLVSNRLRRAAR